MVRTQNGTLFRKRNIERELSDMLNHLDIKDKYKAADIFNNIF